jgi:hypothetical protein
MPLWRMLFLHRGIIFAAGFTVSPKGLPSGQAGAHPG